jgi:hypothetical protein
VARTPRIAPGVRTAGLTRVVRAAGFVVGLGIVVFVAVTAARDVDLHRIRWPLMVPAVAAALVWWGLLAAGWCVLADGRATRAGAGMWGRTQALRYLPGGFWGPASRAVAVSGRPVDRVLTVLAENLVSLGAGLAVAGVALALTGRPGWVALVLAPLGPLLAVRLARGRIRVDAGRGWRATALGLGAFVAYAVAAVMAQGAISGFEDPVQVAGAATLAWAAGLVVVIAPGGVGVREAVYVALLAGSFGRGDPAAGALVLRLATIAAELLVLVVVGRPVRVVSGHSSAPGA